MVDFPKELYEKAESWPGYHSQTSELILHDLFDRACSLRDQCSGIIEVGCYKGSSSLVLGHVCQEFGWPFYIVDVIPAYLQGVRELFKFVALEIEPQLFEGTLSQFAERTLLAASPALVFVDADHRFNGVVEDIKALLQFNQRPHSAAFHDFSLRYNTELTPEWADVTVDEAIYHALGSDVPYTRIGLQFPDGTPMPNEAKKSFWTKGGSEGVIIEFEGRTLACD